MLAQPQGSSALKARGQIQEISPWSQVVKLGLRCFSLDVKDLSCCSSWDALVPGRPLREIDQEVLEKVPKTDAIAQTFVSLAKIGCNTPGFLISTSSQKMHKIG